MGSIKSVLLDFELDDFFISVSTNPFKGIPFMPSTYKLVALLVDLLGNKKETYKVSSAAYVGSAPERGMNLPTTN